jgi:hypothetical protein
VQISLTGSRKERTLGSDDTRSPPSPQKVAEGASSSGSNRTENRHLPGDALHRSALPSGDPTCVATSVLKSLSLKGFPFRASTSSRGIPSELSRPLRFANDPKWQPRDVDSPCPQRTRCSSSVITKFKTKDCSGGDTKIGDTTIRVSLDVDGELRPIMCSVPYTGGAYHGGVLICPLDDYGRRLVAVDSTSGSQTQWTARPLQSEKCR